MTTIWEFCLLTLLSMITGGMIVLLFLRAYERRVPRDPEALRHYEAGVRAGRRDVGQRLWDLMNAQGHE
jgi:hypothetical protein